MVKIKDLQKYSRDVKSFDYEFFRLLDSIGDLASLIKKFKKRKIEKEIFKIKTSEKLARMLVDIARIANSLNVDLEKQFENWWKQKTKKRVKIINVEKGYNLIAKIYDKLYNPAIITEEPTFLKLVGNVKNKKVLDVGCGTGRYTIMFSKKGAKVEGIDISQKMLNIARQKAEENKVKIKLINGNMLNLPYESNKFDIIVSSLALDHVKEYDKAISEFVRVCKPRGKIIFSVLHPDIAKGGFAWFEKDEEVVLIKRHTKSVLDLMLSLNKHGATIDRFAELKVSRKIKKTDPYIYSSLKNKKFILIIRARKIKNDSG